MNSIKTHISSRAPGQERKSFRPVPFMLMLCMMLFIGIFAPASARADDLYQAATCPEDSLFCIEPEDYSLMWLRTAFPELVSAVTGTNSGGVGQPDGAETGNTGTLTENLLFSNLMKVLNSAALAVASLMLSYKILAGVVQTANDGEVLGRRWSTLWGPLRVITAAGLLVPTTSGYSLIQAVIIMIAVMGIGFANGAWRVVVKSMVNGGALVAPAASQQSIEIARQVFKNNICMHAINMVYTEMLNAGDGAANPYKQVKSDGYSLLPWGWMNSTPEYKPNTAASVVMEQPAVFRKYETVTQNNYFYGRGFEATMRWTPSDNIVSAETGLSHDVCGAMKLQRNISGQVDKSDGSLWGNVSSGFSNGIKIVGGFAYNWPDTSTQEEYQEAILKVEMDAIDAMARKMDGAALTVVRSWYPFGDNGSAILPDMANQNEQAEVVNGIRTTIINSAVDYERDLAANLQQYRNQIASNDEFREEFEKYALSRGWASAGEWYLTMARLNQMSQELNHSNPEILTQPDVADFFSKLSTLSKEEAERFKYLQDHIRSGLDSIVKGAKPTPDLYNTGEQGAAAQKFNDELIDAHGSPAQGVVSTLVDKTGETINDIIGGMGKTFASVAGTALGLPLETNTTNPLITIVDGGRRLFYTGIGLNIAEHIRSDESKKTHIDKDGNEIETTEAGPGWWAFIIFLAFPAMIVPGVIMGYIIPLLPWVLWVSALLGWFILVVEAVIAGPLWALAHMRMDGEGISGPMGEQGYRLALSVMLRPLLMIVGLIAGLVVLTVFIPFIGASIWVAEAMNDAAGAREGFFTRLALIVIQSFLMIYVCYRCFNLITHVPDRVLRWIGQGGEGLGEAEPVEQTKALFIGGLGTLGRIGGPIGATSKVIGHVGNNQGEVSQGQSGGGNNTRGRTQNDAATRIARSQQEEEE